MDRSEVVCCKSIFSILFSFHGQIVISLFVSLDQFRRGAGTREVVLSSFYAFLIVLHRFVIKRILDLGLQKEEFVYT